jgi:hypothetical protein
MNMNIMYIVACLPKTRIVKPAETAVARQWLRECHVTAAALTYATIEELLEAVCFYAVRYMAPSYRAAARKGVSMLKYRYK